MNGILPVDKPQGFTSFDVIAKLRGILKIKKLGHSGTLDPLATGVLPVFIGKATRACDLLPNDEKSYTAGFKLGIITDTQDITGAVKGSSDIKKCRGEIEDALSGFLGETKQLPPMYSAVSVGGRRLYELARQGLEVERHPRTISVFKIQLLDFDENTQTGAVFISCSRGTYIRTIINDMGERLQSFAVMTSLVRNSSGGFSLDECLTLEEIIALKDENKLFDRIVPVEKVFDCYEKICLDEPQTSKYKNGVKLDSKRISYKEGCKPFCVFGFDGSFLGLAKIKAETDELVSLKNFY